ncbi:sensor histidine kinase [Flavobacterium cerinum]|uniref:Histidine kinase n=1 Tax=Flavobacterium cerinum TaxID=2502784 RepID=A0ABY5IVN8_9FLAO|nr:histidine kinase [Flavobacterium cerinum]UUC46899.1 histidine kinase [Flavobacterium cerinum]
MLKKKELRYHILFWGIMMILDHLLESIMRDKHHEFTWKMLQGFGFTGLQMLIFYLNYLWICPKTIPYKKWKTLALGQLGLFFLFPALRFIIEEIIIFNIVGNHNYVMEDLTVVYYVYDNSYYVIRVLLLSSIVYIVKDLWITNEKMNVLQLEKKQAELQVLKNQLSPHFLFNTLNSFYSDLYDTQPKEAADIMKLSEMLRYVTYENENDLVLLRNEMVFLQHYIDLFQRRFDNTIAVEFRYPDNMKEYRIPSLLLIHFVENAFKHGILDDENHPVSIAVRIEGDRLLFTSTNHYRKSEHYDERGIGQKNIVQRLAILFPDDHVLKVDQDESSYTVILNIPLL